MACTAFRKTLSRREDMLYDSELDEYYTKIEPVGIPEGKTFETVLMRCGEHKEQFEDTGC